jgi:hypothetical protein
MRHIFTLIFSLLIKFALSQTNVFNNGSFEELDSSSPISFPQQEGQVHQWKEPQIKYLNNWESRSYCSPDSDSWNCYPAHSPDWFKLGGGGYFGLLNAPPDGQSCIGMANHELVQQDISNQLLSNTWYSFKGNIFLGSSNFQASYDINGCNETELYLYTSKQKIQYKREQIAANTVCINDGYNHSDGILQNIKVLKKFKLNTNQFTPDTWQDFEFLFKTPDLGNNNAYNWIAIETRKIGYGGDVVDGNCMSCYILLDNLQIFDLAGDPCCKIRGDISDFSANTFSANTNPWVCNANNITGYNMDVFDRWGDIVYHKEEYNPNGLDNENDFNPNNSLPPVYSIKWNGTDNNNNFLYNSSPFNVVINLYNCTQTIDITRQAVLYESLPDGQGPMIYPPNYPTYDLVEFERADCCIPNRFFDDTPQRLSCIYEASNKITATNNCVITSNQNITFKAGNQVILEPGFSTEDGASFNVQISPVSAKLTGWNVG